MIHESVLTLLAIDLADASYACIAPAVAAKLFGPTGLNFTIGNDAETAKALEQWGGSHIDCSVDEIVIDESLKIIPTPAYMLAQRINGAQAGISKMISALLERTLATPRERFAL